MSDWKGNPAQAWHVVGNPGEPAFQNSWALYDGSHPVKFRVDDRRVQLVGRVAHAAITNSVIFTLPSGFRPSQELVFVVFSGLTGNGFAVIVVGTDGSVMLAAVGSGGATSQITLDQISFIAEQ